VLAKGWRLHAGDSDQLQLVEDPLLLITRVVDHHLSISRVLLVNTNITYELASGL